MKIGKKIQQQQKSENVALKTGGISYLNMTYVAQNTSWIIGKHGWRIWWTLKMYSMLHTAIIHVE